MMPIKVSIVKNGKTLGQEVLDDPQDGDVTAAAGRVIDGIRKKNSGPLWPYEIDVRAVDDSPQA